MSLLRILFTFAFAAATVGCGLIDPGPERRTLIVLDHMVECTGNGPQLCMLVHEPGSTEPSRIYFGIEGFAYEWGYLYEIDVEDHRVRNPPADGSSIRTVLRRVISKERVPEGTEFEIFLTGGPYSLAEGEPDRYRAYDSVDLICGGAVDCAGLSTAVAAGSRIGFRLRHQAAPDLPLEVVAWEVCDRQLMGSSSCTS